MINYVTRKVSKILKNLKQLLLDVTLYENILKYAHRRIMKLGTGTGTGTGTGWGKVVKPC